MLTEGSELAGYRIVRLLGSGGMGSVYLAVHPSLPRHDALKVRNSRSVSDADELDHRLRATEARVHPR
jgi:serine/threonine-protein kinase